MDVKFVIVADCELQGEFVCFRWCRDAQSGIARAISEAKRFGVHTLSNFRAVPIAEWSN